MKMTKKNQGNKETWSPKPLKNGTRHTEPNKTIELEMWKEKNSRFFFSKNLSARPSHKKKILPEIQVPDNS